MFDQESDLNEVEQYLEDVREWIMQLWLGGRLSPEEYESHFRQFMHIQEVMERIREREDDIEQVEMGDGFISSEQQLAAQRLARRMLKQQEEL